MASSTKDRFADGPDEFGDVLAYGVERVIAEKDRTISRLKEVIRNMAQADVAAFDRICAAHSIDPQTLELSA